MIRNPYAKTTPAAPSHTSVVAAAAPPRDVATTTTLDRHDVVPSSSSSSSRAPMHHHHHQNITTVVTKNNNVPEFQNPPSTNTNRIITTGNSVSNSSSSSSKEPSPKCTNLVIDLTTDSTISTTTTTTTVEAAATKHLSKENHTDHSVMDVKNSKYGPSKRPSSSSSSSSVVSSSSQLSQPPSVSLSQTTKLASWNINTNNNNNSSSSSNGNNSHHHTQNRNNIPPPHPRISTTTTTSSTARTMLDRYFTALPPEIRFASNDPITQPVSDEYRTALIQNATLSEPLLNGWSLYSHQKRAILVSLLMRRHILALDMGLGKTVIACTWARAFCRTLPNLQVVILCPVSLKEEWQRTAQDICGLTMKQPPPSSSSSSDTTTGPTTKPKKRAKTTTIGTNTTSTTSTHPLESPNGVVTICSWAKVPHPHDISCCRNNNQQHYPYVVVADEAHSMQSMTSGRTKEALQLMLAPQAVGVLLLTGTPMKNGKPANLFPLLRAVKHPFGNHQRAYEAHFCGGRDMGTTGRSMWVATGAANLDQLRVLTKSHMLHMTKDDVLKELPKQTRIKKTVFVSSKSQMRHNDAMRKLSLIYENRSSDPFQQEAILGAVQNMRLVDSFAKVTATVEVAREVLRKEPAVVIFTSFVDVAKMVHEKLSDFGWAGELLTGETPAKKRQGMVDKFQNGLSPVFCCTFGAGGVGLTLTAACTVILLDRPWTPGDVHQAEDRVRRIGQTKPVTSIWMSAFELDKQIDEMIESKSQTSSTVLSEQSTGASSSGTHTPKLSILKMVQSFLSGQSSSSDGYKQATLPDYGHGSFKTY